MLSIHFIDRDLPEAVQRRLTAMLFDAPASTVAYIIGLAVMTVTIWLRNGDVLLTVTALACVVIISMRVAYVAAEKPAADQQASPAYLPALLSFGVAYSVAMAALVVRAFAIGDEMDIALVVMAASGYLSGLTIRAAAVPSLAIVHASIMFAPLLIATSIHSDYWSVAVLLLCYWTGSINLIMTMNGRIISQLMAEYNLARIAATDALTGAVSRAAFDAMLTERLKSGSPIIAIIDLDKFKPINDTHGHAAGDELLRSVVERMRCVLAGGHIVARIGGDEFAVLFDDMDVVEATRLAETVISSLKQPFALTTVTAGVEIGASAGMAVAMPGDTAQSLRQRADERLYDAKRDGRGHVTPARSREVA